MLYPASFENKIGFDKIRLAVIEKCSGALSKEEAIQMAFSSNYEVVRRRLNETFEMLGIMNANLDLPLKDMGDINVSLIELKVEGSYLSSKKLFSLLKVLEQAQEITDFFQKSDREDDKGEIHNNYPGLLAIAKELTTFPQLIGRINQCINKFGEIKDNASEKLYELRRNLRLASGSMSKAMRRVLDRAVAEGLVDKDVAPSMRDGRLVLPVEAGKKRMLNGIIHDASSTGKTVFIEPLEVVEAGNKIRELEIEIQHEEIEILKNICAEIRAHIDSILNSCKILAKLDFIRAKALFAQEVDGRMPNLTPKRMIEWYHAVHPQLLIALRKAGKEVVPLNLTLDNSQRILIISGPNAGGKSVCLKTTGVVQYMAQCGLLPTIYENSHLGIFDNLFVDIGDEQSMENDLSTYSSHLKNMKYFLRFTTEKTLILIDEMGSGTEPQIGGALAQSILEKLSETKCLGIITTHYQNLKTFAGEKEGFINGAMMYDRQHLSPTFQLSIGNPGSSFAIEIARKIGLGEDVINKAREIVGSDYVNLDKYLLDVARDRRYWANKRQNIKEKENHLDKILSLYEDKADDLKSKRNQIIKEAQLEAKEILASANARIEKAIREIREAQADKEKTKIIRKDLEDFKSDLLDNSASRESQELLKEQKHKSRKKREQAQLKKRNNENKVGDKRNIEVGSYVKMKDGNVAGQVIKIEGKRAEVAFGAIRTMVELNKLIAASKPKESVASQGYSISRNTFDSSRERQLNFKQDIDIRGMRGEEAVQTIIYFLDDAVQFSASRLRILHGTGTGILKTLIRQQLDANPNVKSYRDEDVRFGGAGITVVDLK